MNIHLPNGFLLTFGQRRLIQQDNGAWVILVGHVFDENGVELGTCPGVCKLGETLNPSLVKQLFINHVQSLNDVGLMKLGLPPFDQQNMDRQHPVVQQAQLDEVDEIEEFLLDNAQLAGQYVLLLNGA